MAATTQSRPRAARVGRHVVNVVAVGGLLLALVLTVPMLFGLHRYVITGGSMSGSFELGAVVFARDVPVEDLRVGDVITYYPPASMGLDNLVTHRISAIDQSEAGAPLFTTKGDANADVDPWQFTIDAPVQPVVSVAIDYVGWPLIWLSDPGMRMVLIGVPAALIFLGAAKQAVDAVRRPDAVQPQAQPA